MSNIHEICPKRFIVLEQCKKNTKKVFENIINVTFHEHLKLSFVFTMEVNNEELILMQNSF